MTENKAYNEAVKVLAKQLLSVMITAHGNVRDIPEGLESELAETAIDALGVEIVSREKAPLAGSLCAYDFPCEEITYSKVLSDDESLAKNAYFHAYFGEYIEILKSKNKPAVYVENIGK